MSYRVENVAPSSVMGEDHSIVKNDHNYNASVTPEQDELIRAKGGDHDAFESLMRRHERRVFTTALRVLGDANDAEDITQDVFFRLFQNLDRLDPTRPLEAWIYRVTVNSCLKQRRKALLRRHLSLDRLVLSREPRSKSSDADPSKKVICAEETKIAEQALALLPVKERAALVLRDIQGLSTRDVAQILGSTETTVRSQISRARLKLRAFRERSLRRNPS